MNCSQHHSPSQTKTTPGIIPILQNKKENKVNDRINYKAVITVAKGSLNPGNMISRELNYQEKLGIFLILKRFSNCTVY